MRNKIPSFFCRVVVPLTLSLLCSCATTRGAARTATPEDVLQKMVDDITESTEDFGSDLNAAAKVVGKYGLDSPEAKEALRDLYADRMAYMIDCSSISADGIMVSVEPGIFKHLEGSDISDHALIVQMKKEQKPALGDIARTVENIPAVSFAWPVFDEKGAWIGSISALFKPDLYMKDLIKDEVAMSIYDAWILGKGGKFFYNPDPNENGKNIFTNPYNKYLTEFVAVGKRITEEPEGIGEYRMLGPGQGGFKLKRVRWDTVKVHNAEVRVVLVEKMD